MHVVAMNSCDKGMAVWKRLKDDNVVLNVGSGSHCCDCTFLTGCTPYVCAVAMGSVVLKVNTSAYYYKRGQAGTETDSCWSCASSVAYMLRTGIRRGYVLDQAWKTNVPGNHVHCQHSLCTS